MSSLLTLFRSLAISLASSLDVEFHAAQELNAPAFDLNQSLSTQAPFTGNWLPAFNSTFWNSYRPNPPNPPADINRVVTGQLSRLDGLSTQGNWQINIANGSNTQTGTLASWSLVVQPRAFSCEVFVSPNLIFHDSFE